MKRAIIAIIFCISLGLNAQVALPTFQGAQYASFALYSFSSHTFTNCGATGRSGPTLANCKSSYSTTWENDTDLFNVQTQGIQEWTVPSTGTYRIEAYGAQGGNGSGSSTGGLGARMRGDFSLTKGEVIKIMVGQQGGEDGNSVGGGGGTFVIKSPYNNTASILVIAGGGGGEAQNSIGTPAGQTTNNGAVGGNSGGSAGTSGNAGGSVKFATGGAGFSGNSSLIGYNSGSQWSVIAYSFVNGGVGARGSTSYGEDNSLGGFGGGGASCSCSTGGGGGGGGYSGGGGGGPQTFGSYSFGGGGGSYNAGSNTSNSSGARSGHGQVIITKQ